MAKIIALIILAGITLSCNQPSVLYEKMSLDGNRYIIKKIYSKNGELISEERLFSDSTNDGFYREYQAGSISVEGEYKGGKKEGAWVYYDFSRDTIKVENWFSGKRFGRQTEFFSKIKRKADVSQIYKITFCNIEGEVIFETKFDIDGNITSIEGTPYYYAYNKSSLLEEEEFELVYFYTEIPGLKSEVILDEFNEGALRPERREVISDSLSVLLNLPYAKKYSFNRKYSKGRHLLNIRNRLIDKKNNAVLDKKSKLEITVR
ncbi:hypothetical protein [Pseudoflavitalea rhizosphaerae]|uniref:hypothetical protein n=1 Tax=Pseudoflavitalea rhizosphaerae TaxID=1884793 RepID=UPI000F8DA81E|nr:hypothetical protein [Pseudoflavitalea rhizosphaerae]